MQRPIVQICLGACYGNSLTLIFCFQDIEQQYECSVVADSGDKGAKVFRAVRLILDLGDFTVMYGNPQIFDDSAQSLTEGISRLEILVSRSLSRCPHSCSSPTR